ncbi:hypothetical protein UCDDS831_g08554 [Diplodia seriata]|uniref:Uncharacterized protein n=1 Tax=Diplodia seriata TaxID=420778 RepID=A0A0G2FPT6_9PEZI|nr:hypothetical protein UCDDS831_g08554 [Diplodia seriata]
MSEMLAATTLGLVPLVLMVGYLRIQFMRLQQRIDVLEDKIAQLHLFRSGGQNNNGNDVTDGDMEDVDNNSGGNMSDGEFQYVEDEKAEGGQ